MTDSLEEASVAQGAPSEASEPMARGARVSTKDSSAASLLLRRLAWRQPLGVKETRISRRAAVGLVLFAMVVGGAAATLYTAGATGTAIADTIYVTSGASCPIASGWSSFPPAAPSTGVAAAGMAYDYKDGYVVYFGGYTGSGGSPYVGSTWEYSGGCWNDLGVLSTSPDGRSQFAMAWDGTDNQVVLFGGSDNGGQCSTTGSVWLYLCGDTWGFSGGAWTVICNNHDTGTGGSGGGHWCTPSPPLLTAPTMAYDPVQSDCNHGGVSTAPATGCVFLYGGLTCASSCTTGGSEVDHDIDQLWEFFSDGWHSVNMTGGPPPGRDFGAMTYDAQDGYLLLYGGEQTRCTGGSCTYIGGYVGGPGGSCVFDSAMSEYCDDAWSLSAGTWTQQCQGHADYAGHTDDACYPPGTVGSAMVYDPAMAYKYDIDYGGFNGEVSTFDSDANGYVYASLKWVPGASGGGDWSSTLITLPANPSRFAPAMVWDAGSQDQYVMIFGGTDAVSPYYYATFYIYK
jgi:hypothetical protein